MRWLAGVGLGLALLSALAVAQEKAFPDTQAADRIPITLKTDKPAYAVGDLMQVEVKADASCYFILYYLDASGEAHVVVPSPFSSHDRLYAGQTLRVLDSAGHPLQQKGPAGTERIQVIASRERLDLTKFRAFVDEAGRVKDPAGFVTAVESELTGRVMVAAKGLGPQGAARAKKSALGVYGQATTSYDVR